LAILIALDLFEEGHGTIGILPRPALCWLAQCVVIFFGRALAREGRAVTRPLRDARLEFVKTGSQSDQAERTRALGGPWTLEEKANVWNIPFTLRNSEIIDMCAPSGKSSRLALPKS
jgi:hypothetical protein